MSAQDLRRYDGIMSETWQVAALLEEIAKKADPLSVLRTFVDNARKSEETKISVSVGLNNDECTAMYSFPLDSIMKGVDGTPEEVVDYLKTGLSKKEHVILEDDGNGRKVLIVMQTRLDENLASELRKHMGFQNIVEQTDCPSN